MKISEATVKSRQENNPRYIIDCIPYAQLLGINAVASPRGFYYQMPPQQGLVGNPRMQVIHGGALGGFMEMAATLHLLMTMGSLKLPKVVDFSIDYLRAGRLKDTFAHCELIREGRTLANVHVESWQDSRENLIARARMHFLLE
jgi:acyl-coenzyme A thioesterase PaaI-like protein